MPHPYTRLPVLRLLRAFAFFRAPSLLLYTWLWVSWGLHVVPSKTKLWFCSFLFLFILPLPVWSFHGNESWNKGCKQMVDLHAPRCDMKVHSQLKSTAGLYKAQGNESPAASSITGVPIFSCLQICRLCALYQMFHCKKELGSKPAFQQVVWLVIWGPKKNWRAITWKAISGDTGTSVLCTRQLFIHSAGKAALSCHIHCAAVTGHRCESDMSVAGSLSSALLLWLLISVLSVSSGYIFSQAFPQMDGTQLNYWFRLNIKNKNQINWATASCILAHYFVLDGAKWMQLGNHTKYGRNWEIFS